MKTDHDDRTFLFSIPSRAVFEVESASEVTFRAYGLSTDESLVGAVREQRRVAQDA